MLIIITDFFFFGLYLAFGEGRPLSQYAAVGANGFRISFISRLQTYMKAIRQYSWPRQK